MNKSVFAKLSAMMFLQFFIWGAWYVTVGNYMAKVGMTEVIFWAYTVGPIGAIVSPFFLGMVVDRFFATEKVLGTAHILGGIAMFCAPFLSGSPTLFIFALLIHMLCYMPTVGLANTLAFHHVTHQEKEFPLIRVFGTVGWIVANIIVSAVLAADEKPLPLQIAGIAGIVMGFYCFTLPHTPPPAAGKRASIREIIGLDALARLKSPSFNIFIISREISVSYIKTDYIYSIPLNFNIWKYINYRSIFNTSNSNSDILCVCVRGRSC